MVDCILRRMELSSFRSFSFARVDLENPTFLVGPNGSGKSNFTDALAFLSEAMASPLQAVIERRGGVSAISHRSSETGPPAHMKLAMRLVKPDAKTESAFYTIELVGSSGGPFEVASEQCVIARSDGTRVDFARRTDRGSTQWKSSIHSFVPAIGTNALALPLVGGDDRFSPIVRFLAGMRFCRIEPAALRAIQDPDGGSGLRSDGRNTASVLREIKRNSPGDWERVGELLEVVVPGTVQVLPKIHGKRLTLEFEQASEEGARPIRFEALSMSDGTLRALGLIAAVFQRPKPSLLIIEEPEASIHPGALGAILDLLRLASASMQVIVTTHSPDILDAKWIKDRHIRILTQDRGGTCISRVSQSVRNALEQHIMGPGELLRSNALTAEQRDGLNEHEGCP